MQRLFTLLLLFSGFSVYAQNILPENQKALQKLANNLTQTYHSNYQQALNAANNQEVRKLASGEKIVLHGIDAYGGLLYMKSDNKQAAISSGIDKIQTGGSLGYPLSGKGIHIGVWEVGDLLTTHQEIKGKVEKKDAPSSIGIDNHSTHVTTTIIGNGIYEEAKGMAFDGNAVFYTSANDLSEIASEAAEGMLLSNHSYGSIRGWYDGEWYGNRAVSTEEDYLFGFYSRESKNVDQIAYDAPYYLMVKSAGNDRGDGPREATQDPEISTRIDGPYDCIGAVGVSKNILTVGAVNDVSTYKNASSVVMSAFSSWGPADDGRIKPDIVANGVNVLSAYSDADDAYASISGTSMSAPTITGALALLQELYHKKNHTYMKAATLKGLAIHTAKEAGEFDGPDYAFGWGLLSADQAAYVINTEDKKTQIILEDSLLNEKEYQIISDGTTPLTITLSWTDVAGSPVEAVVDPIDLMLVNDLDIRLESPSGEIHYPWILDPSRPSLGATKGDNFRDNVEKIEIKNPLGGTYTLKVTHKGTLVNGVQDYSLIASTSSFIPNTSNVFLWRDTGDLDFFNSENWEVENIEENTGIPTQNDIIKLDENAFQSSLSWTLDKSIEVFALQVESQNNTVELDLNGNEMIIYDHLKLSPNTLIKNGTIHFKEKDNYLNNLAFVEAQLQNITLVFEGSKHWEITGLSSVNAITVKEGFVTCKGNEVEIAHILVEEKGKIAMPFMSINGLENMILKNQETQNDFSNCQFIFKKDHTTLHTWEGTVKDLQLVSIDENNLKIDGQIQTDTLSLFASNIELIKEVTAGVLNLENVEITFSSNSLLETNQFYIQTSEGKPFVLMGADANNPGRLQINEIKKQCIDFTQVKDVILEGNTTLNLTANAPLEGNTQGWLNYENCEDALFVNFEVAYNTLGSLAEFTNLSEGAANQYIWLVNQDTLTTTTELLNIEYIFDQTGTYEVTFSAQNEEVEKSITKRIEVTEATLDTPLIEQLSDDFIYTISSSPTYQWYKDNILLEGETSNKLDISLYRGGDYQVMIRNKDTRLLSDIYRITVITKSTTIQERDIQIYPLPSITGKINVNIKNPYIGILHWQLYTLEGVRIKQGKHHKTAQPFTEIFDFSDLKKGFYLFRVAFDEQVYTIKIILE